MSRHRVGFSCNGTDLHQTGSKSTPGDSASPLQESQLSTNTKKRDSVQKKRHFISQFNFTLLCVFSKSIICLGKYSTHFSLLSDVSDTQVNCNFYRTFIEAKLCFLFPYNLRIKHEPAPGQSLPCHMPETTGSLAAWYIEMFWKLKFTQNLKT